MASVCESAAALLLANLIENSDQVELVIVLCDDKHIHALNRDYRGRDSATDVLSFPQEEDPESGDEQESFSPSPADPQQERLLGDIVVSVQTASRQAEEGGWSLAEETVRLVLHGLLHLLGHDHVNGGAQEQRMKAEEARLAQYLAREGIACASDLPIEAESPGPREERS